MTRETIDVCVCTFRRESLSFTLASLAAQQLPTAMGLRVIVADNDATDARRTAIMAQARTLGLACHYVHAPERNISVARNACLDAATADWIAFIDDDEVAAPDWLATLAGSRAGHQIVFGVSQARYPDPATPAWVIAGDFHSNRIEGNDGYWNGYTANVLIDRQFAARHGLRFAEALGQIGGEDTMFFLEADLAGASFGYCPEAIVFEDTPLARANLRWLLLRRYRAGQVHHMGLQRRGKAGFASIAAVAKAAILFGASALSLPWRDRSAGFAMRAALQLGHVSAALGFAPYREYGGEQGRVSRL